MNKPTYRKSVGFSILYCMNFEELANHIEEKVKNINDGKDMLKFQHINNGFPSCVSCMFNDFCVVPNTSVYAFNNYYSFSFSKNVLNTRFNGENRLVDIVGLIIKNNGQIDEMFGNTEFVEYKFDCFIESFRESLFDINQWEQDCKLLTEKGYILYDHIKPNIKQNSDKNEIRVCNLAEKGMWYLYKRNKPSPLLLLTKKLECRNMAFYIYEDNTFKMMDHSNTSYEKLSELESHDINELYSIL